MERRAKVELFEQIRREYEFGVGSIKGVARKLGVHRRMVRQALAEARPPERKSSKRSQGPIPDQFDSGSVRGFDPSTFRYAPTDAVSPMFSASEINACPIDTSTNPFTDAM
jgi:hypothetical protein